MLRNCIAELINFVLQIRIYNKRSLQQKPTLKFAFFYVSVIYEHIIITLPKGKSERGLKDIKWLRSHKK